MTANLPNLLPLIDQALAEAQRRQDGSPERAERLRGALESIRSQVNAGSLEPSRGVVTLGLTRAVADWGEPLDSHLIQLLGQIEAYYRDHCRE
jgi:hypothetical protein